MNEFNPQMARESLRGEKVDKDLKQSAMNSTPLSGPPKGLEELMREDFRYFLREVWKHLGLPKPTLLQYSIAGYLQHGPDRSVIMGFRGVAKTWITATFGVWRLWLNQQFKVLVVSGTAGHAAAITNFALGLIRSMPCLEELIPGGKQRASTNGFDVKGATPDPQPSFRALGITSQLPGNRSDLIIGDDVETNTNSATTVMREKLRDQTKEFDAILKPGGSIKYLGTPQSQNSIYFELPQEIYQIRIWPARYPNADLVKRYGRRLAPVISRALVSGKATPGQCTEPGRFTDDDLYKREVSWGKSGFALQYMLDPTLSDVGLYPLKLKNLIIMSLDPVRGPSSVAWGNDERLRHTELPVLGLDGDGCYKPASISDTTDPFVKKVMTIDPSGTGSDELAFAIGAELHGRCFVLKWGGYMHGYAEETLKGLAKLMVQYTVGTCVIEDDFGDGMFTALLRPHVIKAWEDHNKGLSPNLHGGTSLESVKAPRTQKELRIINVLEPALDSHKVVVDTQCILDDQSSVAKYDTERNNDYTLAYQLTHLTRERDCLGHDDRLEALAMLVAQFTTVLGINTEEANKSSREEEYLRLLKEIGREEDDIQGEESGAQYKSLRFSSRKHNM